MPRDINEHPFSPLIQCELLALLLHRPALFREYVDCWQVEFFDDLEVREILFAWLRINDTGQVPGRSALEYLITSEPTPGAASNSAFIPGVLEKLEALFNLFPENDKLLLQRLEKHATDCNMYEAMGAALSAFEAGQYGQAVTALNRGLATGARAVKLAGDEWYEGVPVLSKEVIPGILRRGKVGMINGHPKSYKSWTLLHLAIAAATGRAWWFGALPPIRVLYVNMELDAEELKLRVDKLTAGMGLSRAALKGQLQFLNLEGFDSECSLEKIAERLRLLHDPARPWELVIIEPVYKLLTAGRDLDTDNIESNNSAVGAMFCILRELARELDTALFLCHHFKKGNAAETATIDSGAGAGMFGRNPDAIFALHPVRDEEEEGETVKGAYIVKSEIRYFPSPDDFGIKLDPNHLIFYRDITINPHNVAGRAGHARKGHIGQVLVILEARPCTFKAWKDHAKEAYGMNDRRMTVWRDEAMEKAYVTADGPTSSHKTIYTITALGKEAMRAAEVAAARNGSLGEKMREMRARMDGNGN